MDTKSIVELLFKVDFIVSKQRMVEIYLHSYLKFVLKSDCVWKKYNSNDNITIGIYLTKEKCFDVVNHCANIHQLT